MNILTKQSCLPCRWPFDLLLSYQNPLSYPSAPVHALWRLSLKQNDEEMLLLVPSDFTNSGKKALCYCNTCCCSYRYNKNILTTETATGTPSVTPCRVWELCIVFVLLYFQSLAPGFERSKFGSLFL